MGTLASLASDITQPRAGCHQTALISTTHHLVSTRSLTRSLTHSSLTTIITMPSHQAGPLNFSRPDSWPPVACRSPPVLDEDVSTDEDEYDLPILKRNPLTYFLTPATPKEDELEFAFDFDAGIEDSTRPREMVRSISPSTLDGLKRYRPRARGKGKDRECAILDDEDSDEEEDYSTLR